MMTFRAKPLAGEGQDGGRGALHSPPPKPSPIKGEGTFCVSKFVKYLPLSAPVEGEGTKPRLTTRLVLNSIGGRRG